MVYLQHLGMGTQCATVCQNPKLYPYLWYPFWKHCGYSHCHDLISLSYHFPLFYILISSFQPFSQLCSCSYSVVGTVSQAIFVLLLFHSPFGQYLMGISLSTELVHVIP